MYQHEKRVNNIAGLYLNNQWTFPHSHYTVQFVNQLFKTGDVYLSIKIYCRGAWVAQSVKQLTLDFSSGRDLRVLGSGPASGSALSGETASGFSLLCPFSHSLFLSQINKYLKRQKSLLRFPPSLFLSYFSFPEEEIFFFFKILFSYLRERERDREQGEGQRENLKQTPSWEQSPTRDLISSPWDHDLSWNQESDT